MYTPRKNLSITLLLTSIILLGVTTLVEAQSSEGCCTTTITGERCAYTTSNECKTEATFIQGQTCEQTSTCKKGCCYHDDQGIFDLNTLATDCQKKGTGWQFDSLDPTCTNKPGSKKGCCNLAGKTYYNTQGQCTTRAQELGQAGTTTVNWDSTIEELACILQTTETNKGACILTNNQCTYTTPATCHQQEGDFYEGKLCTDQELRTTCTATTKTTCVEGEDAIYYEDSCGNTANIYDITMANNKAYWTNTYTKEDSCGNNNEQGNLNSQTCGNCDRLKGTTCTATSEGKHTCKSTSCEYQGKTYKNGEKWCGYDGQVGKGNDVVGSTHYLYYCNQGTIETELCEDARAEICAETTTATMAEQEVTFNNARCVKNNWKECLNYNSKKNVKTVESLCKANPSCRFETIKIASNFIFSSCLPNSPGGFELKTPNKKTIKAQQQICARGTQTCYIGTSNQLSTNSITGEGITTTTTTITQVQANADCLKPEFTQKMNDYCRSLGDCGAKVNIEGTYRQSIKLKNAKAFTNIYLETIKNMHLPRPESIDLNPRKKNKDQTKTDKDIPKTKKAVQQWAYFRWVIWPKRLVPWMKQQQGKEQAAKVTFKCLPWDVPDGGKTCESCNDDPLKPCTPYRCESLGAACTLINKDSEQPLCIDDNPNDVEPPRIIKPANPPTGYQYTETTTGIRITTTEGTCLEPYTTVTIELTTNEPSKCEFSTSPLEQETLKEALEEAWGFEHSYDAELLDPSHGQSLGLDITANQKLYTMCKDTHGNINPINYIIDYCVKEGPDQQSPIIKETSPENNEYLGATETTKELEIYTNELSTCKWDTSDKSYDAMSNTFLCEEDINEKISPQGYTCQTTLQHQTLGEQTFYIRCKDQPWLEETSDKEKRNEMIPGTPYTIKKPTEKISITSITPNNKQEVATTPTAITINVETTGGTPNHYCAYSTEGYDKGMIELYTTGKGKTHTQPRSFSAGTHNLYIYCWDESGEGDEKQTSFTLLHDNNVPQLTRVWEDNGILNLMTSERAECKYSLKDCGFTWTQATSMGTGYLHTTSITKGETYHVKCKDDYGNTPTGCTASITIP